MHGWRKEKSHFALLSSSIDVILKNVISIDNFERRMHHTSIERVEWMIDDLLTACSAVGR